MHHCLGCANVFISHAALESALAGLTRAFTMQDLEALRAQCRERVHALVSAPVRAQARIYEQCPVCQSVLTRKAFASGSGIITYVCAEHGVLGGFNWLKQALEYIARGGEVLMLREELAVTQERLAQIRARENAKTRPRGPYLPPML